MFGMSNNIGIDLGTANTLVSVKGKGVVLNEPTVVATNNDTKDIIAVGLEARQMIGRTPGNITVVRPMQDGVIADYDTTAAMLKYYIKKAKSGNSFIGAKPNVVICVPSGITKVEERAVVDAAKLAGAKMAFPIAEPFAAAIGADLPVWEPTGSMIVDIGGGTTEVAVISLGGIVSSMSIKVAGNTIDESIKQHIRHQYNLMIGDRTSEAIKIEIGNALLDKENTEKMDIRGRNLMTGLPETLTIKSDEITLALEDNVNKIVHAIRTTLEKTPPELSADVMNRGIVISGGGAMLRNIDKVISESTDIPVFIAEDPLESVAIGTGKALDYIEQLKKQANASR